MASNFENVQISQSSTNSNHLSPKWQRFSDWMHCICVVTFDLELGQAMEVCLNIF